MGTTTNNLLAAADKALTTGEVDMSEIRNLHAETAATLGLEDDKYYKQVVELLDECEGVLQGVGMLGELSPKTRDFRGMLGSHFVIRLLPGDTVRLPRSAQSTGTEQDPSKKGDVTHPHGL